jgi:hypothetical protein
MPESPGLHTADMNENRKKSMMDGKEGIFSQGV